MEDQPGVAGRNMFHEFPSAPNGNQGPGPNRAAKGLSSFENNVDLASCGEVIGGGEIPIEKPNIRFRAETSPLGRRGWKAVRAVCLGI